MGALRDRTPEELRVFIKHFQDRPSNVSFLDALKNVHEELLARGLIAKGWWDGLLKDAEGEFGKMQRADPGAQT